MDSPGLNPDGLNLSDDDLARERTRVKSGTLRKLARIVLFSPDIPEEENKHWSILPVSNLKSTPIDLLPDVRMSDEARLERRKLVYKSSGGGAWESMIFCRVEEGEYPSHSPAASLKLVTFLNLTSIKLSSRTYISASYMSPAKDQQLASCFCQKCHFGILYFNLRCALTIVFI